MIEEIVILVSTIQTGYKFSQTWPKNEPYLHSFEQTKTIKLAELSLIASPVIAFITIWLQISYLGIETFNTTLAMSLLILSLPIHGYFILGKQAKAVLPLGLKSWYREIEQQLKEKQIEQGQSAPSSSTKSNKLTYMDLANLLKVLFSH